MSDSVWPHRSQPTRLPRPWDTPGKNTGVGCHFLLQCMKVKSESEVAQSCLTLRDPRDCSLPGSSVHGLFQARVLEWGAIAFSHLVFSCAQLSQLFQFSLYIPYRNPKVLFLFYFPYKWFVEEICQLSFNTFLCPQIAYELRGRSVVSFYSTVIIRVLPNFKIWSLNCWFSALHGFIPFMLLPYCWHRRVYMLV